MNMRAPVETVTLDAVPTDKGLLLIAEDVLPLPIEHVKHRLFAWHEPSFYGTLLETQKGDYEDEDAIVLPEGMSVRYLAKDIHNAAIEVEYTHRLTYLIQAAPILLRCLEEGRFAPDYESWREGRLEWRLLLEDEESAEWDKLLEESAEEGLGTLVAEWPSRVLDAWTKEHSEVSSAWETLLEAYPLIRPTHLSGPSTESTVAPAGGLVADEEDWQILTGWKKDQVPFRVALRLSEPGTADDHGEVRQVWQLDTVLLDRDNPAFRVLWQDGLEFSPDSPLPDAWRGDFGPRVQKEHQRWLSAVPGLDDGGETVKHILPDEEVWRFLTEDSVRLAEAGATVLLPAWWEQVRKQRVRLKAKVRSSVGAAGSMFGMDAIIEFDWRVALGEAQLSEEEFLRLAEHNKRLFRVNGEWVLLDPTMLEAIRKIMSRTRKKNGLTFREAMELHLLGGTELEHGETGEPGVDDPDGDEGLLRLEVELNEHLGRMLGQLQETATIPLLPDPAGFQGELRRYQREGMSWMTFLSRFGLGCCLADDMGLGKTVQWIGYLLHLKESGRLTAPALLICPTSVIGNWQKELERFAPGLNVMLHYGAQRAKGEALPAAVEGADVVLTSYTLTQMDEESLAQVEWSALCLDEAQNIKNAYTKQAAAVRRLNARHRIALTGTPIENRLTELWSIFDVVNPGYLGSLGEFRRNFVSEVEKGNTARIGQVQQLIKPFLLRRVKKDPAIQLDLPDKNEMKTFVPLTAEQGALYESIVQDMLNKVETLSPMERRGLILATLTRLKQVCDHPLLLVKKGEEVSSEAGLLEEEGVRPDVGGDRGGSARGVGTAGQSAKLARLLEMIEELRVEGDKCLIFTQFAQMGRLLQETLAAERGEAVLFLHGGVPKAKRDEMVARFQEDAETGIFVLSLKAGGTGLNLTAANHVFHFDRWWNPAVENQATDRAFRIGQRRDVQVHKFISLGTLEERIDQMIDKKQGLSQQIIGSGENWITELSTDELRELFTLRRQWMEE